jgi:lipopolysaccharide export system protein LptA
MAFTKIAAAGIGSTGTVTLENLVVTGSITASLTGTATTTTNIPNLTGAITSSNTTTSLGSFTSSQLATALTDETGSGAAVFATSPTLVTPVLGAASATSINASGIATASQFVTGTSGSAIGINTNTISGPATITIDPAAVGDNTGLVVIKGDLQIDGTTTTINSTTVTVDDKNIILGSGAINDAAADGSGITIESGNGNKTFQFEDTGDNLGSSENLNVASGKVYKVNNTSVLSSTTLGSGVVNSSLTSVGTLGQLQVTGVSTFTNGSVLVGSGTLTGTASQPLQVTGGAYVSGSFGIGTTNPQFKLDNWGAARVHSSATGEAPAMPHALIVSNPSAYKRLLLGVDATNDIPTIASVHPGTSWSSLSICPIGGNVGIGTLVPSYKLDVYGANARIRSAGTDSILRIQMGSVGSGANKSIVQFANSAGSVLFDARFDNTSAAERFAVQSDLGGECVTVGRTGNVGIGTTNPGYRLDVFSTSFPSARIRSSYTSSSKEFTSLLFGLPSLNSGSQIGYVYDTITPANSYFHITPYGRGEGADFSVNASGNVGIGAITPDVRLHINGANAYPATSGTTPTGFIALRNTAGATHGAYIGVANAAPWGTWIQAQDKNNLGTSYPILLNPNGGNVGIGTINPAEKLDVEGNIVSTSRSLKNSQSGGPSGSIWYEKVFQINTGSYPNIRYLHIAAPSSFSGGGRTSGTVEIIQFGELGGQDSGNGLNYYRAAFMCFKYTNPGCYSVVLDNNVEAGGNTGTGVTGVTTSLTDDEIIYTINSSWYGHIVCVIRWASSSDISNLRISLDSTSTPVF